MHELLPSMKFVSTSSVDVQIFADGLIMHLVWIYNFCLKNDFFWGMSACRYIFFSRVIATGWTSGDRAAERARYFSFLHNSQPESVANPASGAKCSEYKADNSPPFSARFRDRWSYTSSPPYFIS
jgi:hypothetical protein